MVRKNGTIERGRPEHTQGAHASGSNFDSIGICFEGNFDAETMGAAQKNAGIELIQYLKEWRLYINEPVEKGEEI